MTRYACYTIAVLLVTLAGCSGNSGDPDDSTALQDSHDLNDDGEWLKDLELEQQPDEVDDDERTGDMAELLEINDQNSSVPPRESDQFKVRPTVEQIYIWSAPVETEMEIVHPDGSVSFGTTDYQGSLVVRELPPGDNYIVRPAADPEDYTGPLSVLSQEASQPETTWYSSQKLHHGYQYITMRDGVTLSAWVSLPGPEEEGPYPTVLNYSGYSPSRPGQSIGPPADLFCGIFPILCEAPDFPSGLIAGLMGYAAVGVNIRGTGCSGGAYDFFEPLQLLDGYDLVEIVAAQDWVKGHKVGMVGLSYPGISQLYVARMRPPSLASIAPFSVIADTATSTLVPGGIFNDGFALEWIEMVLDKAEPYAHGWIRDLVDAGDTVCEENQLLHSQKLDVIAKARANPYYTDEVAKPLDPSSFAQVIDVPVFLVGQAQDEQTGPHFPVLFGKFDNAPVKRFTMTNGIHKDGFAPQILVEWFSFLAFYVSHETPYIPPDLLDLVPFFMEQVFGATISMPDNRFQNFSDYFEALGTYESEKPLRVIFESGADPDAEPGVPDGTFSAFFDAWPIPETIATRYYFQPDGTLGTDLPPQAGGEASFEHDPEAGERLIVDGSVEKLHPAWTYRQPLEGKALSFITLPLEEDTVLIGHGSVDLWLKSTADDADLEACITEVRPDGMESYVQCGWLRASHRKGRDDATELRPTKTHREEDVAPLESGAWNDVRLELMPMSHIFRSGSRIRLVIDTPGDSMARWRFQLLEYDTQPVHTVATQQAWPSSVVLPVIPGIEVPTALAPCESLRAQPCREYIPLVNTSSHSGGD